jgi:hypothetical protein
LTPSKDGSLSDIFREEALAELHSRGGPGDVLRAGPRWLAWGFGLLLVLIGLGVGAALTIHVREEARGAAVIGDDGRSVKVVLPLAFRGEIRRGATLRLDFGATRRTARVSSVAVAPAGLVARTRLVSPLPDQVPRTGRGSVRVGSETLFDLLRG